MRKKKVPCSYCGAPSQVQALGKRKRGRPQVVKRLCPQQNCWDRFYEEVDRTNA